MQELKKAMESHKVKGFQQVLVAEDVSQGIRSLIQTAGLGGLRHNSVMLGWPYGWRQNPDPSSYQVFLGKYEQAVFFFNIRVFLIDLSLMLKSQLRQFVGAY